MSIDATRIIAIDWSGAVTGAAKKIWLAEARDGDVVRLESGRTRAQITEHLIALAGESDRLIVGLDFAFSMPEWFLRQRGFDSAPLLWQRLAAGAAERWLAACEPPFWGKPGVPKPQQVEAAHRLADAAAKAKSVFQIGGAGAVGTGSLRGMCELHRLREAGFHVWPFDPAALPMLIEIYPRTYTGKLVVSSWQARKGYVAQHWAHLRLEIQDMAIASDDAFDATITALAMDAHRDELLALPAVTHPQIRLEGAIWRPGWNEASIVTR